MGTPSGPTPTGADRKLSGSTRVAAVIGSPVRHSLSPAIHNAAFAACGLDWAYVAFDVPAGGAAAALEAMRTLGLAGLSVTMPHKDDVAAAVDECSHAASVLRAVNCVVRLPDGRLRGENTDGDGFVDALAADAGWSPAGARCVVLGAGGAARSIVRALGAAGAAAVVVVNRTASAAAVAAALAGPAGRVGAAHEVTAADLVVNATSVGMGGTGVPCNPDLLRAGQVVVDCVYHPLRTPLLAAAEARGARTFDGVGMLVHQAAHQFRSWTQLEPPVAAMDAAARAALAARHG